MIDRSKLTKKPDVFSTTISNPASMPTAPVHEFTEDARWSPNVGDEPFCILCKLPKGDAVHSR